MVDPETLITDPVVPDLVLTMEMDGAVMTLPGVSKIYSHDAIGIWRVGGEAWKVYSDIPTARTSFDEFKRACRGGGFNMDQGYRVFGVHEIREGNAIYDTGAIVATAWSDDIRFLTTKRSSIRDVFGRRQNRIGAGFRRWVALQYIVFRLFIARSMETNSRRL